VFLVILVLVFHSWKIHSFSVAIDLASDCHYYVDMITVNDTHFLRKRSLAFLFLLFPLPLIQPNVSYYTRIILFGTNFESENEAGFSDFGPISWAKWMEVQEESSSSSQRLWEKISWTSGWEDCNLPSLVSQWSFITNKKRLVTYCLIHGWNEGEKWTIKMQFYLLHNLYLLALCF